MGCGIRGALESNGKLISQRSLFRMNETATIFGN
jgi:hypothetical protein